MSTPNPRQPDSAIAPQFTERWSPRSFTAEAMSQAQLMQVLEAARWAPSASNVQPWRFAYALRGDAQWAAMSTVPNEGNRRWCLQAAALVLVVGDTAARFHAFDAGCAWAHLALQAHASGWATHAMAGIDAEAARRVLQLPENLAPLCLVAIGRRGEAGQLPEDLRARELPSQRRPLAESLLAWPAAQ